MGKLIRSMDWSKTALGPVAEWPQSLRTSVSLCLSSTFPILIAWGPETIQIYNDSYRPICGAKHPESMGQNFRVCWETALDVVGDAFTRGQQGEGTYIKDQRMFLDRYGYLEEAFMTFSFAPIRDESGNIGGIFHPITETTDKMLSSRRSQVIRDLGSGLGKAKSTEEIFRILEEQYNDYQLDLPFLNLYEWDGETGTATLLSCIGTPQEDTVCSPLLTLENPRDTWRFTQVLESGNALVVEDLPTCVGAFHAGPYEEAPHSAIVLPLRLSGNEGVYGFIVAGISVRRAIDNDYLGFYGLLAGTVSTAFSNVFAYEQELKRAEALAAIDKAKTAFFSNVSHEFRTPLTLMLGPLEDMLQKQDSAALREPLEATHRNALRLLKLVNNLLDYSRVEAGRVKAAYEETDVQALTTDLASSFRSIIEKAGMELLVATAPVTQPVFVDRQMWEKIVLNLISNAFKYTLEGSITVQLSQEGKEAVRLSVTDTGVGIPAKELPHMFERFHRVENARGRTHEGTGIGLSLVHELVTLHGGHITVESVEGEGSTFVVTIPTGCLHLDKARITTAQNDLDLKTNTRNAFLKEAQSLLQPETADSNTVAGQPAVSTDPDGQQQTPTTRILVVDDNNDMRAYLDRLLQPHFQVFTATNGLDALQQLPAANPDLVLSDIMMPVMDGKTLLAELRQHPATQHIPVIFLSARAGEEARIDGLEAGADDYLIKPFSANELLSKIKAQVRIRQTRALAETRLRNLLRQAPVAMAVFSGVRHVVEVANEKMLAYWGCSAESVLGKPVFEALEALQQQGLRELMDTVLQTGDSFVSGEIPLQLDKENAGETGFFKITLEPLQDVEAKDIMGIMMIVHEVTDLVRSRSIALEHAAALEEIAAKKDEFLGIASHEFKSPLTSMKGFLQLLSQLSDKITDPTIRYFIQRSNKQADKLTTLVNELFDISRIDTGKMTLNYSTFPLSEIVEDVVEVHRSRVGTPAIMVNGNPQVRLRADKLRLEQVINNLVDNAFKYAPSGEQVIIGIEQQANQLKLSVTDFGKGIKADTLPYLFDRFYRVQETADKASGLGLGLYISATIIERHGGRMGVESEPGKGSTFWFILPYDAEDFVTPRL